MKLRGALIEDYENPEVLSLTRAVHNNFPLANKNVASAAIFDAVAMHYKHWSSIVFNPKSKAPWTRIYREYWKSDEYKALNEAVHGEPLLAKYATVAFLNKLMNVASRAVDLTMQNQSLSAEVERKVVNELINEAAKISEDVSALKALTTISVSMAPGVGGGFSHEGIPFLDFLENPNELRKRLHNRFVISLVRAFKAFTSHAVGKPITPAISGGVPVGVKTMQRSEEVTRAIPVEMADDDIFAYKFASRTLRVRETRSSARNVTVYIDKSGSMDDSMPFRDGKKVERIPKISVATAMALAAAVQLRKQGAKLTLKFFDTEVGEAKKSFAAIVEDLLRIRASGGTNITRVLEDVRGLEREEKVIVITDGIDSVSEEACKAVKGRDISIVFIDTSNGILENYFKCTRINEADAEKNIILQI